MTPLTQLIFECIEHDETRYVDYYEPSDPPRCSRGDLMTKIGRGDAPLVSTQESLRRLEDQSVKEK